MKNLTLTLAAVTVVSASALAQPPGGGFGLRGLQPLTAATVPAPVLGKELKLSEEVLKKVAALQKGVQDKQTAAMQELRESGGFSLEAFQELQKKNQENGKKAETEIIALLTDDQKKALPDVIKALQTLQTLGIPLPLREDLKLTEEQTKTLTERAAVVAKERAAISKQIQEAMASQDFEKVRELGQGMRGNGGVDAKAAEILTAEQKALIEKYVKEHPQPQGRRGGGN